MNTSPDNIPTKDTRPENIPTKDEAIMAARRQAIAEKYSGQWGFLKYLTGISFSIYNEFKTGLDINTLNTIFAAMVRRDGMNAECNALLPMYCANEPLNTNYTVPLLINGNVIIDIYRLDRIDNPERIALKAKINLTHADYGMIINFAPNIIYTEKYIRDRKTGIIDRI